MNSRIKKLVIAGVCLALGMILPFITGGIPKVGNALSPMHIPVLLAGFLCGFPYGIIVGFISPLLRYVIFGMPPIFPIGTAMAFELAVYGGVAGILYQVLPKKNLYIYVSLITAMLAGRIVWGGVMFIIAPLANITFTFKAFLNGAFIVAVPGIIVHILLIPAIVIALKAAGLTAND